MCDVVSHLCDDSDNIDLCIDNYSREELLEIIDLDSNANNRKIETHVDRIITKYTLSNDKKCVDFFIKVKKKLLYEDYSTLILDNEIPTMMNKEIPNINNASALEIEENNNNNTTIKHISSKVIIIDSQFRPNILPYSSDPNSSTSSTNFTCTLTEKIKNVMRLKLHSIYIPRTWYTFDIFNFNTTFKVYRGNIINETPTSIITIQDGNYTTDNLLVEIQNQLNSETDLSGLNIRAKSLLTENTIVEFFNTNTDVSYTILFYSNKLSESGARYDQNLGYSLGYRVEPDENHNMKIFLDRSGTEGNIVTAESPVNIDGPQYFMLIMDDFNNINNNVINIEDNQSKLPLPANFCIDKKVQLIPILESDSGRQFTQAEIYSINEKINSQNEVNNRKKSPNNSNVFAVIHLPNTNNKTIALSYSGLFNEIMNERKYFAPCNIEKLKISLLDDKGNTVNLHGHNWSFSMIIDEIYQY